MSRNYYKKIISRNYYRKLSAEIITGNCQHKLLQKNFGLVYQSRGKCEIYRDTDVSKNHLLSEMLKLTVTSVLQCSISLLIMCVCVWNLIFPSLLIFTEIK